ncbi:sulfotransferase 2B1-like [Nematolebias whitei]|uniref:sulfotransferase 2B1-like n=1 Tax=Nematolebias whitei TaxID=451745 RepID=UPI0018976D22|nr:sulfotransferase 2B1-like [Nematolebias whitei]
MSSFEELYLHYRGLPLPRGTFSEDFKYFEEFNFKDDDILVVTYPKSGTTWMKEILTLVLNSGDLTLFQTIPCWLRVPHIEMKAMAKHMEQLASPRSLSTHFLYNMMPSSLHTSKAKVIYVMRNPKDILVSSYYFHQMANFLEDPGTLDEFMDKFLKGRVFYGKWTDHVKSWKCAELGDRIMFITYEEMIQDLPASVTRISNFLCHNLSEDAIPKIAEYCSFKSMKDNKMSNYSTLPKETMDHDKSPFMRKGIAGDWKIHLNSEQQTLFTSAIRKELEGQNFSLPWSLD